jgi:hypothetical protein
MSVCDCGHLESRHLSKAVRFRWCMESGCPCSHYRAALSEGEKETGEATRGSRRGRDTDYAVLPPSESVRPTSQAVKRYPRG